MKSSLDQIKSMLESMPDHVFLVECLVTLRALETMPRGGSKEFEDRVTAIATALQLEAQRRADRNRPPRGRLAVLKKLSICACGHPLLKEHIPLGAQYTAFPEIEGTMNIICGGCGSFLRNLRAIGFTSHVKPDRGPQLLPLEAFEFVEEVPNA